MYGRLYRRNSIEFKERTEQDASVMLELELNRLRQSGKLGPTADKIVKTAFDRFQELFCTYLEQEGPDHDIDIDLPKIQPLPQVSRASHLRTRDEILGCVIRTLPTRLNDHHSPP